MNTIKTLTVTAVVSGIASLAWPGITQATANYEISTNTTTTVVEGAEASEFVGSQIISAGDLDGDGYDDLIIGAPSSDRGAASGGAVYILYGSANGIADTSLTGADASIFGTANQLAPDHMGVGDLNGDGFDDFAFSGYKSGPGRSVTYLWYGSATRLSGSYTTDDANAYFDEGTVNSYIGSSLSLGGDLDQDGYGDLLIGDDGVSSQTGAVYLFYGSATQFSGAVNMSTAAAKWNGVSSGDEFGTYVSTTSDLNGDGYNDVIAGARSEQVLGSDNGSVHVFYSSATRFSGTSTSAGADASFTDSATNARMGDQITELGDINMDGNDDMLFRRSWSDSYVGAAYLIYGTDAEFSGTTIVNVDYDAQFNGARADDEFGYDGASGDVNADGINDILISATGYDADASVLNNGGATFVYYGGDAFSGSIATTEADVMVYSASDLGTFAGLGMLGDLNGDGGTEVAMGYPYADGTFANNGKVFITAMPLAQIAEVKTLPENRVRVTFDDATTRTITCFDRGSAKPVAVAASSGRFVLCAKSNGHALRVFNAYSGTKVSGKRTFNKSNETLRLKRTHLFDSVNADQAFVLGRHGVKVRLAYLSVNLRTGKLTVKDHKKIDTHATSTDRFNVHVKPSVDKLNIIKNGSSVLQPTVTTSELQ